MSELSLKDAEGKPLESEWKTVKPDELEVKVPLQKAAAGSVTMLIKKFGLREADEIPLHTYAEAGRLDSFGVHAGDSDGILRGTRLDQVDDIEVNGIRFHPDSLTRANQQDELKLSARDATASAKLHPGDAIVVQGHAAKTDERSLLQTEVEAQRPEVIVLTKSVQVEGRGHWFISAVRMIFLLRKAGLNFSKPRLPLYFSARRKK